MPTDYPYTHTRTDWVKPSEPVTGPAPFPWVTADRVAIHYTAALNLIDGDPGEDWAQLPAYLRAIHHDYLTNPARGYSIGYGIAVDQRGHTWQLRGITWKNAANLNWNHRTLAVLVLVDGADPLTAPAVAAVRSIVAWFRSQSPFAAAVKIVGHRDIGATACPGNGVYAQITAGLFEPVSPPEVDVLVKIKTPPSGSPGWWPHIGLFDSGVARPLVGDDLDAGSGITPKPVTDVGQYRRLAVSIGVDLTDEFPDGHPDAPGGSVPFPLKLTGTIAP